MAFKDVTANDRRIIDHILSIILLGNCFQTEGTREGIDEDRKSSMRSLERTAQCYENVTIGGMHRGCNICKMRSEDLKYRAGLSYTRSSKLLVLHETLSLTKKKKETKRKERKSKRNNNNKRKNKMQP